MVDESALLRRAIGGDDRSLDELLAHYLPRLMRMVKLRLDPRLQGRVDPADLVRQAYEDVGSQLAEYARQAERPFLLWLRQLVGQKLELAHWQHLGTPASREVSLFRGALPAVPPAVLAAQLLGRARAPVELAARAGLKVRIQEALNSMDALDRELLTLRHFEQLSNADAAQVLDLNEAATCNRYVRALERLHGILCGTRTRTV